MEGVNMEGANKRGAHANGGARVRPFVPRINERSHPICSIYGDPRARGRRDIDEREEETRDRLSFSSSPPFLASNVRSKGGRRRLSPDATKGAI